MNSLINIGLIVAYIMLFVAIAALVIFPVVSLIRGNMKNARGTLMGVGVLLVVLILAYLLSPADQGAFYTKMGTSPQTSKLIGAGLLSTYIIFASFILITAYTAISKWFK